MDDKNEHGLKLEKLGQYFSRFNGVPAKITKQTKSWLVVVPDQICSNDILFITLLEHFMYW